MNIDAETLAFLLWRYDLDAPYAVEAGEGPPRWPVEKWREWSRTPHEGDCTGLPAPCTRCDIDYWLQVAEWVAKEMGDTPRLTMAEEEEGRRLHAELLEDIASGDAWGLDPSEAAEEFT